MSRMKIAVHQATLTTPNISKNTSHRYISLNGAAYCNCKLSKNIKFVKDIHLFSQSVFQKICKENNKKQQQQKTKQKNKTNKQKKVKENQIPKVAYVGRIAPFLLIRSDSYFLNEFSIHQGFLISFTMGFFKEQICQCTFFAWYRAFSLTGIDEH